MNHQTTPTNFKMEVANKTLMMEDTFEGLHIDDDDLNPGDGDENHGKVEEGEEACFLPILDLLRVRSWFAGFRY